MGPSPSNVADSKSPKQSKSSNTTPPRNDSTADSKSSESNVKPEIDGAKPLGPPPRPGQTGNTPDYFGSVRGADNNLSLEPNPFEQSFGGGSGAETPGGTKLPPVAHITSPSALLPGTGTTPFNWGSSSLRTGPLSPAMLSGPAGDYFDTHMRGGFPTPNESSLRTGLTPGGSGSMFPAPSPNSQQLFAQLASGGVTPSTLDFHRTAVNAAAAAKREGQNQANSQNQTSITSQPQDMPNGVVATKSDVKATGPFDPHDNDAANGLFMLAQGAQGRSGGPPTGYPNSSQPQIHGNVAPPVQPLEGSPPMQNGSGSTGPGSSTRGGSEGSDEAGTTRPNTRGKGKKNGASATTNGRRKAEEPPAKGPANKKAKTASAASNDMESASEDEDDDMKGLDGQSKSKMTDEEKRKNFLERNRVAALKCRQRKKQWLANLQSKVEMFSSENDALTTQITQLREEVVSLKTLLLAHKDCPVTQQQGLHGTFLQQPPMEPFNPQMNPYAMGPGMQPNQQVMAGGQGAPRRYS